MDGAFLHFSLITCIYIAFQIHSISSAFSYSLSFIASGRWRSPFLPGSLVVSGLARWWVHRIMCAQGHLSGHSNIKRTPLSYVSVRCQGDRVSLDKAFVIRSEKPKHFLEDASYFKALNESTPRNSANIIHRVSNCFPLRPEGQEHSPVSPDVPCNFWSFLIILGRAGAVPAWRFRPSSIACFHGVSSFVFTRHGSCTPIEGVRTMGLLPWLVNRTHVVRP